MISVSNNRGRCCDVAADGVGIALYRVVDAGQKSPVLPFHLIRWHSNETECLSVLLSPFFSQEVPLLHQLCGESDLHYCESLASHHTFSFSPLFVAYSSRHSSLLLPLEWVS